MQRKKHEIINNKNVTVNSKCPDNTILSPVANWRFVSNLIFLTAVNVRLSVACYMGPPGCFGLSERSRAFAPWRRITLNRIRLCCLSTSGLDMPQRSVPHDISLQVFPSSGFEQWCRYILRSSSYRIGIVFTCCPNRDLTDSAFHLALSASYCREW